MSLPQLESGPEPVNLKLLVHDVLQELRDPRDEATIGQVIDAFLVDQHRDGRAFQDQATILVRFAKLYGRQRVADLSIATIREFIRGRQEWRSAWTKGRVVQCIRRCLRWACYEAGLTREYRFATLKAPRGLSRLPMTDPQFRALLRGVRSDVRRFALFLRLTGCRPGEARALRWDQVDWEKSICRQASHKTAESTGAARIIVLVPVAVALLRWIQRHKPNTESPAAWLYRFLDERRGETIKVTEVTRGAEQRGISPRSLYLARRAIGAVLRWAEVKIDGRRRPRKVYDLSQLREPPQASTLFVFLSSSGKPWHRGALTQIIRRARRRQPELRGASFYGLRHRFITEAIRANVNLLVVSHLAGHTTCRMTEHYARTIAADVGLLVREASRVPLAIAAAPLSKKLSKPLR